MRTTVTLDPDADAYIRRLMRERGLTFKQGLAEAIRAGAAPTPARAAYNTQARPLGPPKVDLTKALRLAAELEDDAVARKLAERR